MSFYSFQDRGHWGNSRWRGNCSGHMYKALFEQLKPSSFVDPMVGSGTSIEVATEMGIPAVGLDLHSGFNILRDSIRDAVGHESALCLGHPPYGDMIVYSGEVWGEQPHPDDLSRCGSDEEFCEKLHQAILNERDATMAGGHYGIIVGDLRRNGVYRSYQAEMIARLPASELAAVLIKAQHNVRSDDSRYAAMKLPRIMHEYVLLWMKPKALISLLGTLAESARQQQARLHGTWRAIVHQALVSLGGSAELPKIYELVETGASERVAANQHWREAIRRTLQEGPFKPVSRGEWALA